MTPPRAAAAALLTAACGEYMPAEGRNRFACLQDNSFSTINRCMSNTPY